MIFLQEAIWDKQAKHSVLVTEEIYLHLGKVLHYHQQNYEQISLFNLNWLNLTKQQKH